MIVRNAATAGSKRSTLYIMRVSNMVMTIKESIQIVAEACYDKGMTKEHFMRMCETSFNTVVWLRMPLDKRNKPSKLVK